MQYRGQSSGTAESDAIVLEVTNEDETALLSLMVLVPEGNQQLPTGTYTYAFNFEPFTFFVGGFIDDEGLLYPLSNGSVTIIESEGIYTITFDLRQEWWTVVGTVTGTLDWVDATEPEEPEK